MTQDTLEFPAIDAQAAAPAPKNEISVAAAGAIDLAKLDLTDVALAQFGDWRADVKDVETKLTGLVHDLSTQARIDDAKSLRFRLIGKPRAGVNNVSEALKSKLTAVSKAVGVERTTAVAEYNRLETLITPQIEAREAELEAERQARARIESERKAKHEGNLATLAGFVEHAKGLPYSRIADGIAKVTAIVIDRAAWEEFADRAEEQRAVTIERLQALHTAAVAVEEAAAAAEAERVERERVAAEQAEVAQRQKEETERLAAVAADLERQRLELVAQQEAARKAAEPPAPEPEESKTRPEEVGGQVDGCRAPESQPEVCSGHLQQDETSLPASPAPALRPAMALASSRGTAYARFPAGPEPEPALVAAEQADKTPTGALADDLRTLLDHLAEPFASKFPTQPKPSVEWWADLRVMTRKLQARVEASNGSAL